jgi:hypothetical protein
MWSGVRAARYRAGMPPDSLRIRWSTGDPAALALRLKAAGFHVGDDGVLAFPGATVRLERGSDRGDRLAVDGGTGTTGGAIPLHPNGIEDVVAIGWATVDRERFLASATGGPNEDLARDPHLGAFVVRHGGTPGGPQVHVLEPDTEGRLVSSLVRSDEGPAALYLLAGAVLDAFVADARRRGAPVSSVRDGPLGPSVILLGGEMWGPHLLVVERPSGGTIAP